MGHTILLSVTILGSIGLTSSVILYYISQKFKVYEDPRIDIIQHILPGANCGGCGFTGCRNFAEALIKAESLEGYNCPVGGENVMAEVAKILGKETFTTESRVAVVRCQGSYENCLRTSEYDGVKECIIVHKLYGGETDCQYGCLKYGDCVKSCLFDAMYMDEKTGLPVILDDKCTGCGACVKACPRNIIELRKKAKKDRKIFVSCVNTDKGALVLKICKVACTGCNKCYKICEYDAITINNFLAYIDSFKCTLCRKCVTECPTGAIVEMNFPPRKTKSEAIQVPVKEE